MAVVTRPAKHPDDPLEQDYCVTRELLGCGADGGVVRGVLRKTGEWHALKFVSRGGYHGDDPGHEVEMLQQFDHPNIVRVLNSFPSCRQRPNFVMCMPEADCDLADFIGRSICGGRTRMTPDIVQDLMVQLLRAGHAVHSKGMIHRDIKPANILLSFTSNPTTAPCHTAGGLRAQLWLSDFSRARVVRTRRVSSKRPRMKATLSTRVGTYVYAAPELTWEQGPYDQTADIWSIGAVFFELLTQERMIPNSHTDRILTALTRRLGDCPAELTHLAPANKHEPEDNCGLKPLQQYVLEDLAMPVESAVAIVKQALQ